MNKRQQTGFTLYELMITLMVVAVILGFGIPNMRNFTLNSRMTSTANDLHAAFLMARSEAAHAKTNVTICASADPMGAANCGGTWDQGYVVFIDNNADLVRDAGEAVLRAHPRPIPACCCASPMARAISCTHRAASGVSTPAVIRPCRRS